MCLCHQFVFYHHRLIAINYDEPDGCSVRNDYDGLAAEDLIDNRRV